MNLHHLGLGLGPTPRLQQYHGFPQAQAATQQPHSHPSYSASFTANTANPSTPYDARYQLQQQQQQQASPIGGSIYNGVGSTGNDNGGWGDVAHAVPSTADVTTAFSQTADSVHEYRPQSYHQMLLQHTSVQQPQWLLNQQVQATASYPTKSVSAPLPILLSSINQPTREEPLRDKTTLRVAGLPPRLLAVNLLVRFLMAVKHLHGTRHVLAFFCRLRCFHSLEQFQMYGFDRLLQVCLRIEIDQMGATNSA
jgi:hypothetical protein